MRQLVWVTLSLLVGCATMKGNGASARPTFDLQRLLHGDPVADARAEIGAAAGAARLLYFNDVGVNAPGLASRMDVFVGQPAVEMPEVSDTSPATLYEAVTEYAAMYNLLVADDLLRRRGERLFRGDPVADARRAVTAGDFRFVRVADDGGPVPGLSGNAEEIGDRAGVREIKLERSDTKGIDETVYHAEVYNLVVLRAHRDAKR